MKFSKEKIFAIVAKHQGSIVDYGVEGLLILDRTRTKLHTIDTRLFDDESNAMSMESELTCFLENKEKTLVTISIIFDDLLDDNFQDKIVTLLTSAPQNCLLQVSCYFYSPPISWKTSLHPILTYLQSMIDNKYLFISLIGPFAIITSDEKEFLFQNNIHLFHVCDPTESDNIATLCVLQDFADFGFKIPFVWYDGVIRNDKFDISQIDDYLLANRYAGLAIPLLCHTPLYSGSALPIADDYIGLLVHIYKRYPYYDDVLFPLTTIVNNCLSSAYLTTGQPCSLNFLFSKDRGLCLYGHLPALAVPCTNITSEKDVFSWQSCLLTSHSSLIKLSDRCRKCPVQSLCGGEFTHIPDSLSLLCDIQKFFIKVFLWERWKSEEKKNKDNLSQSSPSK
jgi:hypothetical protein